MKGARYGHEGVKGTRHRCKVTKDERVKDMSTRVQKLKGHKS